MKTFRLLLLLLISLLASSCANHYTKQYFETDEKKIEQLKSDDFDKQLARVYMFREKSWAQDINFMMGPMPPLYFGLNGKLIAVMPLGSYVVLYLPPGNHNFHWIAAAKGDSSLNTGFKQKDHVETLVAGNTYYIGASFGITVPFGKVDSEVGRKIVESAAPARQLYGLKTVSEFRRFILGTVTERVIDTPRGTGSSSSVQSNTSTYSAPSASASDFMPSKEQIQSFAEGVAAVMLIGLLIVGLAAGSADSPSYSPSSSYQSPPALIQSSNASRVPLGQGLGTRNDLSTTPSSPSSFRNSYGSVSEIVRSKDEVEIRNRDTGITYRVEDGRIRGSDGSRLSVIGNSIYSDTGQQYRISGDYVYTPDGKRCQLVLETIRCQ